jgi:hypothetical protein
VELRKMGFWIVLVEADSTGDAEEVRASRLGATRAGDVVVPAQAKMVGTFNFIANRDPRIVDTTVCEMP